MKTSDEVELLAFFSLVFSYCNIFNIKILFWNLFKSEVCNFIIKNLPKDCPFRRSYCPTNVYD